MPGFRCEQKYVALFHFSTYGIVETLKNVWENKRITKTEYEKNKVCFIKASLFFIENC